MAKQTFAANSFAASSFANGSWRGAGVVAPGVIGGRPIRGMGRLRFSQPQSTLDIIEEWRRPKPSAPELQPREFLLESIPARMRAIGHAVDWSIVYEYQSAPAMLKSKGHAAASAKSWIWELESVQKVLDDAMLEDRYDVELGRAVARELCGLEANDG